MVMEFQPYTLAQNPKVDAKITKILSEKDQEQDKLNPKCKN